MIPNYDDKMRECFKTSHNLVVPWLLAASFCYYRLDQSILSDAVFDKACRWLLDNYDGVTHKHKYLLDKGSLEAGTLYHLIESDYPLVIRVSAYDLIDGKSFRRNK